MPRDRPAADELIASVAEYLAIEVGPALAGHDAFEALIAANLLAIALRELELSGELQDASRRELAQLLGREASLDQLEAQLAEEIREGALDERLGEVLSVLRRSARGRLRIANPEYLREEK